MSKLGKDLRVARRAERKLAKASRLEAKSKAPMTDFRPGKTELDRQQVLGAKERQGRKAAKLRAKYTGVKSKDDLADKKANIALSKVGENLSKGKMKARLQVKKAERLGDKASKLRK